MSFVQRLSKTYRKSSEGSETKPSINNEQLRSGLANNRRFTQFEKHHEDLKSILQYLENQKSITLCATPARSKKGSNAWEQGKLTKSVMFNESCAKQNSKHKMLFQKSPERRLKLKVNNYSNKWTFEQPTKQAAVEKRGTSFRKTLEQNPQNTPSRPAKTVNSSNITKQKRGIPNIGNTCYMNAVLQCLFHLKDFSEGFLSHFNSKHEILSKYLSLFDSVMGKGENCDVSTLPLKKSVSKICSLFIDFHQEDAHQFLKELLDSIHIEINRVKSPSKYQILEVSSTKRSLAILSEYYWNYYKKFDDSYIYDSLCGQVCNYVTCANCQYESISFDNFLDISLPLVKGKNKIEELLKDYFDTEALSDFYFCSSCKKSSKKSQKRSELWKLPNYLIIQMKRSQFGKKNNQKIRIPVRCLNLKPYAGECQKQSRSSIYNLQGVVLHRGVMEGGHYWAQVKDGLNWYSVDDDKVQKLDKDKLIAEYQQQGSEAAYILFYKML